MLQNYHYNVPIEHFAKLTGRSLAAFKSEDFSQVFQTSATQMVAEKKDWKKRTISSNKKSESQPEIYLELGFENLSHFYTSFKQKFGATPASIQ